MGVGTKWRIPQKDLQEFIHLTESHLRSGLKSIQYDTDKNPLTFEQIEGMASGDTPLLIGYISNEMPPLDSGEPEGSEIRGYYGAAKPTPGGINRPIVPDTVFVRPPVIFDEEISNQRNKIPHPIMSYFTQSQNDLWDEQNMDNTLPEERDNMAQNLIHELLHGKETVTHNLPQKIKTKKFGTDSEYKYTDHPTKTRDQPFFRDAIDNTGLLGDMYEFGADGKPVKDESYTNQNPNYKTSPIGMLIDKVMMDYYGTLQESKPDFIGPVQHPFEQ
tara:strand:- start:2730 stop:3551 length:822 start_codon:yes stop_codon:yes gene_type:complete